MHTCRGIEIFSYFCDNWRKTEFLAPPPARGSRERAQGGELELQFQFEQKGIFIRATVFADKFVSI